MTGTRRVVVGAAAAVAAATVIAVGLGAGLAAVDLARWWSGETGAAVPSAVSSLDLEATPSAPTIQAPVSPRMATAESGDAADELPGPPPTLEGRADEAVAQPTLQPAVDWPDLPELGARTALTTTDHFAVYVAEDGDPLLSDLAAAWSPALEPILAYVSTRLGLALPHAPVDVVFARAYEAPCRARGLASPGGERPVIVLFAQESIGPRQVRAVLAHEIVHHLTANDRFVGDGILTEGLAHWGAGEMLLAWQGFRTWDDAVRRYLAQGRYVSITDDTALNPRPGDDCLERRDRVYNIRTAFVDWLIRSYGLETVLAMPYLERTLRDPETGEPYSVRVPDYEAATGQPLPVLEQRWLAEVGREGGRDA